MPSIAPVTRLSKKEVDWLYLHKCKRHGTRYLVHHSCYQKDNNVKEKIGFLDIETTGFSGSFDFMLSWAIKDLDGKVHGRTITKDEIFTDDEDKPLLKDFVECFKSYDRVITYYGSRFDLPFLRTRAEIVGIKDFPVFGEINHTDLYWIVRNRFKFGRNSLGIACDNLGIAAKGHRMYPKQWKRARKGNLAALRFIWTHNVEDVVSTEELYKRIARYARKTNTSI